MTGSLKGRKVVVTRTAEQAEDLVELLEAAGAVPVVVPLISIVALEVDMPDLSDFDWVVVTSTNAAEHAAKYLSASRASVAAVGETTAAALQEHGVQVSLVPAVQSAAGLLAELADRSTIGSGGRVLVVQAAGAEPTLADGLRAFPGVTVEVIAPYRTVPAPVSAGQQLSALAADAVLFASGSAARAWVNVFGETTPPIVIAIGPQTAVAATAAGLKVTAIAADHSLSGMVSALERELSSNR